MSNSIVSHFRQILFKVQSGRKKIEDLKIRVLCCGLKLPIQIEVEINRKMKQNELGQIAGRNNATRQETR